MELRARAWHGAPAWTRAVLGLGLAASALAVHARGTAPSGDRFAGSDTQQLVGASPQRALTPTRALTAALLEGGGLAVSGLALIRLGHHAQVHAGRRRSGLNRPVSS